MDTEFNTTDKVVDALSEKKISVDEAKKLLFDLVNNSVITLKLDFGRLPNPNGMPPPGMPPSKRYRLYPPGPLPGGGCRY